MIMTVTMSTKEEREEGITGEETVITLKEITEKGM